MNYFKEIIKYTLPFGVYIKWSAFKNKKLLRERAERLKKYARLQSNELNNFRQYDYEESIRVLIAQKLDENQIRFGSIPEKDLSFVTTELKKCFHENEKLTLLHIGNFVGVSLCYFANFVKTLHEESLVVAIDPNIEHRGIFHPEDYVKNLISYFQLDKNVLLIDAFSLEKNLKNDGGVLYTKELGMQNEIGCSHSLKNIAKITDKKFDVCIIDGNHESEYLSEEIKYAIDIMKDGSFIVLDDILYWEDVKRVFDKWQTDKNFKLIASSDRIGIIKVLK